MKLATLANGSRDGRLVVVSKDLAWCTEAGAIALTMQAALDGWARCAPQLKDLAVKLEQGSVPKVPFVASEALAPLPRAYQWLDGSAYVNHVELVRKARNAEMPKSFWTDPLMYQGGSDGFLGPSAPIPLRDVSWGCDLEAEVVVVTTDVKLGATRDEALAAIVLVGLVNDVSLRNLIPAELEKGFGFVQSKPASALSPVLVTPDELGAAWKEGRVHLPLEVFVNGQPFGKANAGIDMTFDFGTLVAHPAKTRDLCAGTVVGSGTVSNRGPDGGPGKPIRDGGAGYSCIAEVRTVEKLVSGAVQTPFLVPNDRVRIEMHDESGRSIFGAIDQVVAAR